MPKPTLSAIILGLSLLPAAQPALAQAAQPAAASAPASALDGLVLAIVGGEEITRKKLVERLVEYNGEEAIAKMVNRAIVLQAAKKAGETVTDEEVDARLKEIKAQFKSEAEYLVFLGQNRLTEKQHREEVRSTLTLKKIALKQNPVTDPDLQQYDVRLLVAKDKATAEKWIKELEGGADFDKMAGELNEDANLKKAEGRMRPFLRIEMLDLARAIESQKLAPGGFTKIPFLMNTNQWGILKLANLIKVADVSTAEKERFTALVTRFRMDEWLEQAKAKAVVKVNGPNDAAIAVVNGEPIPRELLVGRLIEYFGEPSLEQLINRTMLLQMAKQNNVVVTDADAETRFKDFRGRFATAEDFEGFLTRNNLSEKQVRDEIRYTLLMERVALRESPVTDADLQRYDVRLLVAPDRKIADEWVKELNAGADFGKMVTERSRDRDGRASAGKLKPFVKIEMLDVWRPLDEQKVKPGGFTQKPVLLTDGNWTIIKLDAVIPPTSLSAQERQQITGIITSYRISMWLTQTQEQYRAGNKITRPVPITAAIARG